MAKQTVWKYLSLITQIGMTIVVAVAIGTLIGLYLDKVLGTKIIFTLIFIFIGAASGIWSSYQQITRISIDELDK
ncbi:MAG: AtpZ/AtpI family protein [Firmicutes bacterium]|nr:AtpZ/AtpI family protein [Bacillota bacterium]